MLAVRCSSRVFFQFLVYRDIDLQWLSAVLSIVNQSLLSVCEELMLGTEEESTDDVCVQFFQNFEFD